MKASLQLKLGQQLTMTPQLQQAIRLLQLSTLDLQQEIQEALESNSMLELEEEAPQGNTESKLDINSDYGTLNTASSDSSDDRDRKETRLRSGPTVPFPMTCPSTRPGTTYTKMPPPTWALRKDMDFDGRNAAEKPCWIISTGSLTSPP